MEMVWITDLSSLAPERVPPDPLPPPLPPVVDFLLAVPPAEPREVSSDIYFFQGKLFSSLGWEQCPYGATFDIRTSRAASLACRNDPRQLTMSLYISWWSGVRRTLGYTRKDSPRGLVLLFKYTRVAYPVALLEARIRRGSK